MKKKYLSIILWLPLTVLAAEKFNIQENKIKLLKKEHAHEIYLLKKKHVEDVNSYLAQIDCLRRALEHEKSKPKPIIRYIQTDEHPLVGGWAS